jgi:hypothetical protein
MFSSKLQTHVPKVTTTLINLKNMFIGNGLALVVDKDMCVYIQYKSI